MAQVKGNANEIAEPRRENGTFAQPTVQFSEQSLEGHIDAPGQASSPAVDDAAAPAQVAQQTYAQQPGQTYAQQPGQTYAQQPGQTYYQAYTHYDYRQPTLAHAKDHVIAGLLAIFLGPLGIHKFYLGYNSAGFILLGATIIGGLFTFGLVAGVVWIVSLLEGILYLTKTPQEFQELYVQNRREWF